MLNDKLHLPHRLMHYSFILISWRLVTAQQCLPSFPGVAAPAFSCLQWKFAFLLLPALLEEGLGLLHEQIPATFLIAAPKLFLLIHHLFQNHTILPSFLVGACLRFISWSPFVKGKRFLWERSSALCPCLSCCSMGSRRSGGAGLAY